MRGTTRALDQLEPCYLPAKYSHKLLNDLLPLSRVLRVHRAVNAMAEVLAQEIAFNAGESRARRLDLRHNVDAIPVGLNHLGDTADLTLDPIEALQNFV